VLDPASKVRDREFIGAFSLELIRPDCRSVDGKQHRGITQVHYRRGHEPRRETLEQGRRLRYNPRSAQQVLQKVDPPTRVIDAFRDVQAARSDRTQNEAQTYRALATFEQ